MLKSVENVLRTTLEVTTFTQHDRNFDGLLVHAHKNTNFETSKILNFFAHERNRHVITSAMSMQDYYNYEPAADSEVRNILVNVRLPYALDEMRETIPDLQAIRIGRNVLRVKTTLTDYALRSFMMEWNKEHKFSTISTIGRRSRFEPQYYAIIRDNDRTPQWIIKPPKPQNQSGHYSQVKVSGSYLLTGMAYDTTEDFVLKVLQKWGLTEQEISTAHWVYDDDHSRAVKLTIHPGRIRAQDKKNNIPPQPNTISTHVMVNDQVYILLHNCGQFSKSSVPFGSDHPVMGPEEQETALQALLSSIISGDAPPRDQDLVKRAKKITNVLNAKLQKQGDAAIYGRMVRKENQAAAEDADNDQVMLQQDLMNHLDGGSPAGGSEGLTPSIINTPDDEKKKLLAQGKADKAKERNEKKKKKKKEEQLQAELLRKEQEDSKKENLELRRSARSAAKEKANFRSKLVVSETEEEEELIDFTSDQNSSGAQSASPPAGTHHNDDHNPDEGKNDLHDDDDKAEQRRRKKKKKKKKKKKLSQANLPDNSQATSQNAAQSATTTVARIKAPGSTNSSRGQARRRSSNKERRNRRGSH